MVGRVIFSIVGICIGLLFIIYARRLVERITGPLKFAERYFGGGGTYNFYRLLGLVVIITCLLIMFGIGQFIYDSILQGLSGTIPTKNTY